VLLGYHAERRYILVPVTVVLSILIVYFIFKNSNKFYRFSLSMILGGALGNLIDRVFRTDGVVDFLDFQFGNYHFPVFMLQILCSGWNSAFSLLYFVYIQGRQE